MKAPELKYPQLPEDDVLGKAPRPSRRDLVSPPQKVTDSVPAVMIDRSVGHEPRAVAEVVRPPAQHAVELLPHLVPRRLVARTAALPDASLARFHRLLGRRSPQVPVAILPIPHRPEGVAPKGKRLAPPITQQGLLLIERQPHLGEPPATLREHLRRPVPTQDDEVIRVVHESRPVAPVEPPQAKHLQIAIHVDQGQQRRNHPTLGSPTRRPLASSEPPPAPLRLFRHWRLHPHLEQPQHLPIADAAGHAPVQLLMPKYVRIPPRGHLEHERA